MTLETTRRWWSAEEDRVLRQEIQTYSGQSINWRRIALKLPQRSNKDCRKRWSKIGSERRMGAWSLEEDETLRRSVNKHGCKWTSVAQEVATRNADQCSKRWLHFLSPELDHSGWTPEDDQRLIAAVMQKGHCWKAIVEEAFPRRSLTNVKNRYSILENGHFSARRSSTKSFSPVLASSAQQTASDRHAGSDEDVKQSDSKPGSSSSYTAQALQLGTPLTSDEDQPSTMLTSPSFRDTTFDCLGDRNLDNPMLDYADHTFDWDVHPFDSSDYKVTVGHIDLDHSIDPHLALGSTDAILASAQIKDTSRNGVERSYVDPLLSDMSTDPHRRLSSSTTNYPLTLPTPPTHRSSQNNSPVTMDLDGDLSKISRHKLLLENLTAESVEKILSLLIKSPNSDFRMKLSSAMDFGE